jgi:septal ring factor EnvC (AmiA/AmiB activator)
MGWFTSDGNSNSKKSDKDKKEFDKVIKTDKIEGTVPKVADVVKALREERNGLKAQIITLEAMIAGLDDQIEVMLAEAEAAQKTINELEAILYSLLSEKEGSMG